MVRHFRPCFYERAFRCSRCAGAPLRLAVVGALGHFGSSLGALADERFTGAAQSSERDNERAGADVVWLVGHFMGILSQWVCLREKGFPTDL